MTYQDSFIKRTYDTIKATIGVLFGCVFIIGYYLVRWFKKKVNSHLLLPIYFLLTIAFLLMGQKEEAKNYTVSGTKEQWKEVLYVMSKSKAPEPIIKRATNFIKTQLPDTIKKKK